MYIFRMLDMNGMCFLFDGIRMCATQTTAELNMQDDDMIEAGYKKEEKAAEACIPLRELCCK